MTTIASLLTETAPLRTSNRSVRGGSTPTFHTSCSAWVLLVLPSASSQIAVVTEIVAQPQRRRLTVEQRRRKAEAGLQGRRGGGSAEGRGSCEVEEAEQQHRGRARQRQAATQRCRERGWEKTEERVRVESSGKRLSLLMPWLLVGVNAGEVEED
ncbi:hypothetical protein PIB30_033656 [Stylosanthes scabra]|uniref:Uncharacterized protein n=1 Tax=Stylosanthes scabra TaxID=79078 RepID=A0ABU6TCU0_9FABA|nr:hypothetical protein [Stylosanthes scabra]